jgi:hypothetical protein
MIVKNAEFDAPGRPSKGPEHSTRTMLRSHPMRPVPMTAMKMALGAVSPISQMHSVHVGRETHQHKLPVEPLHCEESDLETKDD